MMPQGTIPLSVLNKRVQDAARKIDVHWDSFLYQGMPVEQYDWVEEQRRNAHDVLNRAAVEVMLERA